MTHERKESAGPVSHYFVPSPKVPPRLRQEIVLSTASKRVSLWTAPGVFSARRVDPGTVLLIETSSRELAAKVKPGMKLHVLDLGAGYGPVTIALLLEIPQLTATAVEVNPRAVDLCRANLERLNLTDRAIVHQGDGITPVRDQQFDAVVVNPPIRAGRTAYLPWLIRSASLLRPDGALFVVIRTRQGAASLARALEQAGLATRIEARGSGYKVLRSSPPTHSCHGSASTTSGSRCSITARTTDKG